MDKRFVVTAVFLAAIGCAALGAIMHANKKARKELHSDPIAIETLSGGIQPAVRSYTVGRSCLNEVEFETPWGAGQACDLMSITGPTIVLSVNITGQAVPSTKETATRLIEAYGAATGKSLDRLHASRHLTFSSNDTRDLMLLTVKSADPVAKQAAVIPASTGHLLGAQAMLD